MQPIPLLCTGYIEHQAIPDGPQTINSAFTSSSNKLISASRASNLCTTFLFMATICRRLLPITSLVLLSLQINFIILILEKKLQECFLAQLWLQPLENISRNDCIKMRIIFASRKLTFRTAPDRVGKIIYLLPVRINIIRLVIINRITKIYK